MGAEPALDLHMRGQGRVQDGGPGTVVAASSVLHLNFRGMGYRNGEKLQAPVLNTLPPCPLAAPEGGGVPPECSHSTRD